MQPSPLPNPTQQQNMPMDQQQQQQQHMMPGQQPNMIRNNNNGPDYHKQQNLQMAPYVGQNQNQQMVYNNPMQVNRFGVQQPNRNAMMFPQNQQPNPNNNSALISQLSTPSSIQAPPSS